MARYSVDLVVGDLIVKVERVDAKTAEDAMAKAIENNDGREYDVAYAYSKTAPDTALSRGSDAII